MVCFLHVNFLLVSLLWVQPGPLVCFEGCCLRCVLIKDLIKDLNAEEHSTGTVDASVEHQTGGRMKEREQGQEEDEKKGGTEDEDRHDDKDKAKDEKRQEASDVEFEKSVEDAGIAGTKGMEGKDKSLDAEDAAVAQDDKKLIVSEVQEEKRDTSGEVGSVSDAEVASNKEGEVRMTDHVQGAAGVKKGEDEGEKEAGGGAGMTDGSMEEGGVEKGGEGTKETGVQEEEMNQERLMRGRQ